MKIGLTPVIQGFDPFMDHSENKFDTCNVGLSAIDVICSQIEAWTKANDKVVQMQMDCL